MSSGVQLGDFPWLVQRAILMRRDMAHSPSASALLAAPRLLRALQSRGNSLSSSWHSGDMTGEGFIRFHDTHRYYFLTNVIHKISFYKIRWNVRRRYDTNTVYDSSPHDEYVKDTWPRHIRQQKRMVEGWTLNAPCLKTGMSLVALSPFVSVVLLRTWCDQRWTPENELWVSRIGEYWIKQRKGKDAIQRPSQPGGEPMMP